MRFVYIYTVSEAFFVFGKGNPVCRELNALRNGSRFYFLPYGQVRSFCCVEGLTARPRFKDTIAFFTRYMLLQARATLRGQGKGLSWLISFMASLVTAMQLGD